MTNKPNQPTPPIPDNGWEERFDEMYEYITNPKNWNEEKPEYGGFRYVTVHAGIKAFIQQQLHTAIEEERKRLVEDLRELRHADYEMAMDNFIAKYSPSDKETTE